MSGGTIIGDIEGRGLVRCDRWLVTVARLLQQIVYSKKDPHELLPDWDRLVLLGTKRQHLDRFDFMTVFILVLGEFFGGRSDHIGYGSDWDHKPHHDLQSEYLKKLRTETIKRVSHQLTYNLTSFCNQCPPPSHGVKCFPSTSPVLLLSFVFSCFDVWNEGVNPSNLEDFHLINVCCENPPSSQEDGDQPLCVHSWAKKNSPRGHKSFHL